jgi:hypothetical protein
MAFCLVHVDVVLNMPEVTCGSGVELAAPASLSTSMPNGHKAALAPS